jgi:sec-independent protein translocase protein TatB
VLGLGWGEIALIAALVLVFVGPADLPKVLRFLGRSYGKLRRASDDLRRTFTLEVDRVDAEARADEIQRRREALLARRKEEAERIKTDGGAFPRGEKIPPPPTTPSAASDSALPDSTSPEPPEHSAAAKAALKKLTEKTPTASPESSTPESEAP